MILEFENTENLGSGSSPQVLHMMDNGFRVIYLNSSNDVCGKVAFPELGLYDNLLWKEKGRMSPDENVTYPQLKKVAHYGGYGFWSSDNNHKFVMYMLPTDISHTVLDGSITLSKDTPVTSASFNFQNINGYLLKRGRSIVAPNSKLEVYISFGNSEEILLGIFLIDRVSTSIPKNELSVSARNSIGKLLKEQTFDENYTFNKGSLQLNLEEILRLAEIEDFFVGDSGKAWSLSFEPQTTLLDGITEVIKLLNNWQIAENANGVVGISRSDDARFDLASTYLFERDKTCFDYSTEYSDENTYSKLCVSCKEPLNSIVVDLPPHKLWVTPSHKTLYVTVPDGTSLEELKSYANNLAISISNSGRVETFASKFTPQMVIGDEVRMEGEILGTVTNVKHTIGNKGFYTEFTVDSSGRKGKPLLKDYLSQITGGKGSSKVTIN